MPTIGDVARRAGVSLGTVSRVINGKQNVNPATREKVEQAIRELSYVPSHAARSLRSKQTYALALLVPDITNPFWTTVARGVEDTAQSGGYSVLLCNTDENPVKQSRYLNLVVGQQVDGVIIAPCAAEPGHLAKLRNAAVPTVILDRRVENWEVDTVYADSTAGAIALTEHLIRLGHRRIALVTGPADTTTSSDRVAGYIIALKKAGLPVDPRLIRYGEYRGSSGEQLTYEILDENLSPTAILAANNTLGLGVLDALEKRGLSVPNDMALVCFDEIPDASRFLPFLTVAAQPAYNMGMNAAQLLLSRLNAEVPLQPRQVVLPVRLILRYSCGRTLKNQEPYEVPMGEMLQRVRKIPAQVSLVKPLSANDRKVYAAYLEGQKISFPVGRDIQQDYEKSDVNRLLKTFNHQEPDRVPHLEFWVTSKSVYEYVLERALEYDIVDARVGRQSITPEDHVEFAQRLGMDAVPCNFSWRPNNIFSRAADGSEHYSGGDVKSWSDLENLEPPVPLADQLGYLERYLRAAQGTGVGVIANFTSFFDSAMLAMGITDALYMFHDNRPLLERLMDILLQHQEKVMRAVCDRFADDLAFILINDDIAHKGGLMIRPDMFQAIFPARMECLIAPAKEHGKLLAMHTDGKIDRALPFLHKLGFNIVHPVEPESNDLFEIKRQWAGRLAFVGNIPIPLLAHGSKEEIDARVRGYCLQLAPGGGWVLGSSSSIYEGIPPENFVAMVKAAHRYGRYGSLGAAS